MKDPISQPNSRHAEAGSPGPSPALLFETINSYQKTAAIKAAIELDLFSGLANAPKTADEIARIANAAPRGIRILCDFLTVLGFLTKSGGHYAATPDSALFLDRKSPGYAGGTLQFLLSDMFRGAFDLFTTAVRKGGTAYSPGGSVAPENPVWVSFARGMGPLMAPAADGLVALIPLDGNRSLRVLDVAAGHGVWGLAFAKKYPSAQIVALDWGPVLEVASEHARAAGLADRFSTIAGDAFEVGLADNYDVVLVPNFLHHFDATDCVRFLKRVHAALRPGGILAIVEFVPNEDRVTPPAMAAFSLIMLATTPHGDAYTLADYAQMLSQSGFTAPTQHGLPASMNVALLAKRN